jgi:hypothetical protein
MLFPPSDPGLEKHGRNSVSRYASAKIPWLDTHAHQGACQTTVSSFPNNVSDAADLARPLLLPEAFP